MTNFYNDIDLPFKGAWVVHHSQKTASLAHPRQRLVRNLDRLVQSVITTCVDDVYALRPAWRNILTEIATVEVKVSDWKSAVAQATRNSIFSHHSYIAMPDRIAHKVSADHYVIRGGIGVLAVADDRSVTRISRSRKTRTSIWQYYYKIAIALASNTSRSAHALQCIH
jgi:hypothetical protein